MHDRRDGVEEGERVLAGQRADRGGESGRGERAGGDDDAVPVRPAARATSPRVERDQRMRRQRRRDGGGKAVAVDRQRAAGRHLVGVGRAHDQRAEPAHLRVQQADGVVLPVVGAERVRADQLGEPSVLCAAVARSGRISCSTTGTPACASCQAASEPARPPPMTWTGFKVMRQTRRRPPVAATGAKTKTPAAGAGAFETA